MVEKFGQGATLGADGAVVKGAVRIALDVGNPLAFQGHPDAAGSAAKPGTKGLDDGFHFLQPLEVNCGPVKKIQPFANTQCPPAQGLHYH